MDYFEIASQIAKFGITALIIYFGVSGFIALYLRFAADANNDGKVTRIEFDAKMKATCTGGFSYFQPGIRIVADTMNSIWPFA